MDWQNVFNFDKRKFPDDWSKLSNAALAKNIKYLKDNFEKYSITVGYNFVQLDNVRISIYPEEPRIYGPMDLIFVPQYRIVKIINKKEFHKDDSLYPDVTELWRMLPKTHTIKTR